MIANLNCRHSVWLPSRWAIQTLVRVQQSIPSWATRRCLCLLRLVTPSIFRYFHSISLAFIPQTVPLSVFWSSLPLVCCSSPLPVPCAQPNALTCPSDSLCRAWPLLVWLPRPGDAVLCLYQSRDDLQWNPPDWPDERSCPTCITNILGAMPKLWWFCVYWIFKKFWVIKQGRKK